VGRTLNVKDFDLDRIFGKEGAQIVHLSGLIAALSPETGHFASKLLEMLKNMARSFHSILIIATLSGKVEKMN
jgi:hypothetical protein